MSLDATILSVERDGVDVVLTLGPRIDDAERLTIAGQDRLRIRFATWEPPVGADLWGGGSFVEVVVSPKRQYRREGYTRLYELPLTPQAEADIRAALGGPQEQT